MTKNDFIWQLRKGITDFSEADFHGVDFSYFHLAGLNFKVANLSDCNFYVTSLSNCNLENADLSSVKMCRTALYNVNLTNACLDNASFDFDRCVFDEIEIDTNTMDKYFPSICPSEGEFVGWKKALIMGNGITANEVIVKLLIASDAKRCSRFGRKCRCNKATVLGIENAKEQCKLGDIAYSFFDKTFKYEIGKEVLVYDFNEDRRYECTRGIHFFMTRKEAVNY